MPMDYLTLPPILKIPTVAAPQEIGAASAVQPRGDPVQRNGFMVESVSSKRPASRLFPRWSDLFVRPSRSNRPGVPGATQAEPPQQRAVHARLNPDEWHDIEGPEELDSALSSDLSQKEPPMLTCDGGFYDDEWEDIQGPEADWPELERIKKRPCKLRPVSKLAKGRRELKTGGLGQYREIQRELEASIPKLARNFLASCQHTRDTALAWNRLTLTEWAYLHKIQSESPSLTMPHVLTMPSVKANSCEDDRHAIYRKDLGFEPSMRFLQIMQQLWTEIDRRKSSMYRKQHELLARKKAPMVHMAEKETCL
jgi:hypothetical protein